MTATVSPVSPRARVADVPRSMAWRLRREVPDDRAASWLWTAVVTMNALMLRLMDLSYPSSKIFDEVYYAKDAYDLLRHGVERNADGTGPGFVAHPPLGKWCIALGEWLFGYNAFGWRIAAVFAGTLSVLVLVRVARRLFGSTVLGCVAGLLLTLDGLHFVMSRVALLDVFLMLFVLLAFACLVLDRDARRAQLLRRLEAGEDLSDGAPRTFGTAPWWRFAAGICLGLALGVKWSAMWFVPAFVLLVLVWEVQARRSAGVRRPVADALRGELGWVAALLGFAGATYLATWTGWFLSDGGWDRHWAETTGNGLPLVPDALVNLWHYQKQVYDFHTTLDKPHDYQSTPWSWLTLGRPVAYYYSKEGPCDASMCSAEIIALGTPVLWWSFVPALVASAWQWLARRDWRAGAILLCTAAGLLPWTLYPNRTMFFFYTLPVLPFLVLAVTMALGIVLGRPTADRERTVVGAAAVAAYVAVVAVTFAYFYPVYTGEILTYAQWHSRMWFDSWI